MVCEKVAEMTQMRHDNLANALRLVISACSCQLAAELRYQALAGKKGMVECQRRADIVTVLPRRELAALDFVVTHATAKLYAAEAAKKAGWTAARAEQIKRTGFRKDLPDYTALQLVPFAVETCGNRGKEAVEFVNRLGDIAPESGRIPKGAFERWAMQLQLVRVQWGNAEMYRRSELIISREQGLRYDAGFAVPVLMFLMGHVHGASQHVSGCAGYAARLCVCESTGSDGWLVAWGLCECMLIHSTMVSHLPFTFL